MRQADKICIRQIANLEPWRVMGDPATPILAAYEGDPIQIRLIQGSQEAQHIFAMNGVKWHRIPDSLGSGFTNTQPLGISEHFEFDIHANPLSSPHTDYLYYGSSIDQLWDGMWGIMRVFSDVDKEEADSQIAKSDRLAKLPDENGKDKAMPSHTQTQIAFQEVCMTDPGNDFNIFKTRKFFDISVLQACQIKGNCDAPEKGIEYNKRNQIIDNKAVVYILNDEGIGDAAWKKSSDISNTITLDAIHKRYANQQVEPLVLRASAGQCMQIKLRNHLLDENLTLVKGDLKDYTAYHNFLPMITDGFNINQFRMSSSVGISAPRVAQHPVFADGSNVGLNASFSENMAQGSLVPACTKDKPDDQRCIAENIYWWAGDFTGKENDKSLELGALPLSSFGDPIKHPAHGLIGALVIEPTDSTVCLGDDQPVASKDQKGNTKWSCAQKTANKADNQQEFSRLKAHICKNEGHCFLEQVLVMQDAVSATQGGFPVPNISGADEPDDYGVKAINYKTEPLWARRGNDPSIDFGDRNEQDYSTVFSSEESSPKSCQSGVAHFPELKCDPETPIIKAVAGEKVRFHIVHPGGHTRQQGLTLNGHSWNPYPWNKDSSKINSECGNIRQGTFNAFGPMMGITLEVKAGGDSTLLGNSSGLPQDFLFHSQSSFLLDGGLWGLLRTHSSGLIDAATLNELDKLKEQEKKECHQQAVAQSDSKSQ